MKRRLLISAHLPSMFLRLLDVQSRLSESTDMKGNNLEDCVHSVQMCHSYLCVEVRV